MSAARIEREAVAGAGATSAILIADEYS